MFNSQNSQFYKNDLGLDPMTLVLKLDLDIIKMYHHTKNEVSMSKLISCTDRQTAVLIGSVFKKQVFFGAFFHSGVFFFLEECFLVLFFIKMCFCFIMMAKIIVYTAIYCNILIVPNFFALLSLAY